MPRSPTASRTRSTTPRSATAPTWSPSSARTRRWSGSAPRSPTACSISTGPGRVGQGGQSPSPARVCRSPRCRSRSGARPTGCSATSGWARTSATAGPPCGGGRGARRPGVTRARSSRCTRPSRSGWCSTSREFHNACLRIETVHGPEELLHVCKAVERSSAGARGSRHGPRAIDVDVLLLGGLEVRFGASRAPPSRGPRRRFVLVPLLELDPRPETARRRAELAAALGRPARRRSGRRGWPGRRSLPPATRPDNRAPCCWSSTSGTPRPTSACSATPDDGSPSTGASRPCGESTGDELGRRAGEPARAARDGLRRRRQPRSSPRPSRSSPSNGRRWLSATSAPDARRRPDDQDRDADPDRQPARGRRRPAGQRGRRL